jgi:hypothetical protein
MGGRAVHIPAALSWPREHAGTPGGAIPRGFAVPALEGLVAAVETIEGGTRS